MRNIIIRKEEKSDFYQTESLVRNTFWNVYKPGCSEHYVLHLLRQNQDFVPELDLVMECEGKIIGQIVFVKNAIKTSDGGNLPILSMGPLAIDKQFQRQGLGKKLLDFALEKATTLGYKAVCFEGDINFYGKSGFDLGCKKQIHYYAEDFNSDVPYFLVKELKTGYFDGIEGVYTTPKVYFVDDKAVAEYDKNFPYLKKEKLATQIFS